MQPGERAIQQELRREAAQLRIPPDMWEKISERLDTQPARTARRRRRMLRSAQWKPALALVAAAGMFWLTAVPFGSRTAARDAAKPSPTPAVATALPRTDTLSLRMFQPARRDMQRYQSEEGLSMERPSVNRPLAVTPR